MIYENYIFNRILLLLIGIPYLAVDFPTGYRILLPAANKINFFDILDQSGRPG